MEKEKPILVDCLCCGKKTGHGIPYSVCNDCRRKIDKFLQAKESYENVLMSTRDVEHIPNFDSGLPDVDLSLDCIADEIFIIEKQLEWMKNSLLNIQQEVKSKLGVKEK